MRVIFIWKCSKFYLDLKNVQNNREKSFCFWDELIWIRCSKMTLLRTEYLPSAVNVLANSIKIFHLTMRDFFQLNYLHSEQWILERCCRWDWMRFSACLPCCLLRGPLKRDFLDIYLTTSSGVCNFGKT